MERRATSIRTFTFGSLDRSTVMFSDPTKIRIDESDTGQLSLQAGNLYPTDASLNIATSIANPANLRALVGFQASIRNFKNATQALVTGAGFRLSDGTSQYYYNGSSWVVDSSHWNTETDVANNISTFAQAITTKKFGVIVNLFTTDGTATPELIAVKVAFEVKQQSWMDDLFIRSLVRNLKAQLQPIAEIQWKHAGGNTVDIGAAIKSTGVPFNFVGVDSVFNYSADPDLDNNILLSAVGSIATLSGSLAAGTSLRLNVTYTPNVVVLTTSPDFIELDKLPAIVIEQIRTTGAHRALFSDEVINKAAGTAKQLKTPWIADLDFDIRAITPNSTDLLRLVEALIEFADDNTTITSQALDEQYRLQLIDEFDSNTSAQGSGVCESTASFRLHNVTLLRHSAVDTVVVKRLNISLQSQNQNSSPETTTATEGSAAAPPVGSFPES